LVASEQQDADAPRVREREQHALRLEARSLVVALADHAAVGVAVAVEAGDELAEAGERLFRAVGLVLVAARGGQFGQLSRADQPVRVQMLVRRRGRVRTARREPLLREQRPRRNDRVVRVAEREQPICRAPGQIQPAIGAGAAVQRQVRHERDVPVLRRRREIDILRRAVQDLGQHEARVVVAGPLRCREVPAVGVVPVRLGERVDSGDAGAEVRADGRSPRAGTSRQA
jgi:hypothetical protein